MTSDDLTAAVDLIRTRLGLDATAYHPTYLRRRIHARVAARRAPDLPSYLDLASREPEELRALEQSLTINLTRFFRDPATWDAIRAHVAPALAGAPVFAWSAGCASGEEAWSLAMTLEATLGGAPWRVLATDVDPEALETARAGAYGSAEGVPPDLAARNLGPDGAGVRVADALRGRVRFERHDVLAPPPGVFDLVVCRNVVIYLTPEARDRALANLAAAVRPGGFLVMGRTEILFARHRPFLDTVDLRERVYRRTLKTPDPVPPA